MTTYNTISDSMIDGDSIVIDNIFFYLRDNVLALWEGDPSAPSKLPTAAIADNAVTAAKIVAGAVGQSEIASGAVHQSELDTSTGSVSTVSSANLVLPGGSYGFYPQTRTSSGLNDYTASIANTNDNTSYTTCIYLNASGGTAYAQQRYVNSSPPINMGDGDIPLFFFAEVAPNGDLRATYCADVPPWLYNGPTKTTPTKVYKDAKGGLVKTQTRIVVDPDTKRATAEEIEVNNDLKNADMDLIPHPFRNAAADSTIVLLDPVATEELLLLHNAGEEISDLISQDYIRMDNKALNRSCPNGVMPVSFVWRDTMRR